MRRAAWLLLLAQILPPPMLPAVAADSADVLGSPRERSSFADQEPLAERAEYGKPLPGGHGPHAPSLARPALHLPPGARTLTSFLGSPAAKADAG